MGGTANGEPCGRLERVLTRYAQLQAYASGHERPTPRPFAELFPAYSALLHEDLTPPAERRAPWQPLLSLRPRSS
jgi:hypothetical protein